METERSDQTATSAERRTSDMRALVTLTRRASSPAPSFFFSGKIMKRECKRFRWKKNACVCSDAQLLFRERDGVQENSDHRCQSLSLALILSPNSRDPGG